MFDRHARERESLILERFALDEALAQYERLQFSGRAGERRRARLEEWKESLEQRMLQQVC